MESFEATGYDAQAWLLSVHRLTPATERAALRLRSDGFDIYADNGTKQLIDRVVTRFSEPLHRLTHDIRMLRLSLGGKRRIPRRREVPPELRRAAADAARAIENAVEAELDSIPTSSVIEQQLRMEPTHLIAQEDFTAACLLSLGLEREISGWPVAAFDRLNARTLRLWNVTVTDPRTRGIDVFATLSAVDYATARSAARLAAEAGVEHVALGFAGINLDRTFAEVFWLPNRRVLPGSAPRKFLRVSEIVLGIQDGYRETGRQLRSFHALGLGATAQYPILAAALDERTRISVDATSPLHDAVNDLVFYDDANRGDRVDVIEAASRILAGGSWSFASPFCQYLQRRFGFDVEGAMRWWQEERRRPPTRSDLHPAAPLGHALGVFATAPGSEAAGQSRGRIGHNHWVCDLLAAAVPTRRRREWASRELDELTSSRESHTRWGLLAAREVLNAHEQRYG